MDGMDQSKFLWPRAEWFHSHDFDDFHRPRLHIWGIIVHGFYSALTVSHADVPKGGSTKADVLMWMFGKLNERGSDVDGRADLYSRRQGRNVECLTHGALYANQH